MPLQNHGGNKSILVAGAGVNAAAIAGASGRCYRLASSYGNRFAGLVPELSLIFCAIWMFGVQLS